VAGTFECDNEPSGYIEGESNGKLKYLYIFKLLI